MVRQEGGAGPDQKSARLERYSGRAQWPYCRDQIAAYPAAGSGGADRWPRRDREGVVANLSVPRTLCSAPRLRRDALLIRGPFWVPALRSSVKDAAPRPGHEGSNLLHPAPLRDEQRGGLGRLA